MIWFVLRKLIGFAATVLLSAVLAFVLLGVPAGSTGAGNDLLGWLGHALVGDFGVSAAGPVGAALAAHLSVTVPLALVAMLMAVLIGAALGYAAALRPGSLLDRGLVGVAALGAATPAFWLGMVLALVFAGTLHWLPTAGFVPWQTNAAGALVSLLLPALALALPAAGVIAGLSRAVLVETMASAYLRAAQARGMTQRQALLQHGLRNVAVTVLGRIGRTLAAIAGGALIVEAVFYLPGLGRLILDAVAVHDVVTVRAALVVVVLLSSGTMFLFDLGIAWADRRLRAP